MMGLTPALRRVFDVIAEHEEAGHSPSVREIAAACGFASHGRVQEAIRALEERGWIARTPGRARSLTVIHRLPGPAELARLTVAELDQLLAHGAGVRAHKEGGNAKGTRAVLRRIAAALPPAGRGA